MGLGRGLFLALFGLTVGLHPSDDTDMTSRVGIAILPRPMLDAAEAFERANLEVAAARQTGGRRVLETRVWCIAMLRESASRSAGPASAAAWELAGRQLGALGLHQEALEAHDRAAGEARSPEEVARLALEAAHAARRLGQAEEALERYQKVRQALGARDVDREAAALWQGDMHLEVGRSGRAEQAWRTLAEGSGDMFMRISAFDRLALLALDQGSPESAAGWLMRCRLEFKSHAKERTERGERVRRALLRMRALVATKVAVAERDGWSEELHEPSEALSR